MKSISGSAFSCLADKCLPGFQFYFFCKLYFTFSTKKNCSDFTGRIVSVYLCIRQRAKQFWSFHVFYHVFSSSSVGLLNRACLFLYFVNRSLNEKANRSIRDSFKRRLSLYAIVSLTVESIIKHSCRMLIVKICTIEFYYV